MPETFSDGVLPRISDTRRQKWGKLLLAYAGNLEPTDTVRIIMEKLLRILDAGPPATPPDIPVATAATNITDEDFTANWNASSGATGYRLDVSTSNVFASFVSGYNNLNVGNVTSYLVTGLSATTTYYYRVRATNMAGTSGNSNAVTVLTVPSAPVATAASGITSSAFDANWNASTGASSYRLDVSTSNVFASFVTGYQDLNVGNVTTYGVTGLTGSTVYYFRVRAVNASGASDNSNIENLTTASAYDPETLDWVARVITNGGTVSQGTKDAVNNFVSAINTAGLRSRLWRVNLFAGDQYEAAQVPLFKDHGGTIDTGVKGAGASPATSSDWVYAENVGLRSNGGSQAFFLTGLSTLTFNTDINSAHFGVYVQTSSNEQSLSGIQDPSAGFISFYISHGSYNDTNVYFTHAVTVNTQYSDTGANGFIFGTRTASNVSTLYRNGVSKATNGTVAANFVSASNVPIFAFTSLTTSSFSAKTLGGYTIGLKMDATEQLAYYNAWQAFQTALGRQV